MNPKLLSVIAVLLNLSAIVLADGTWTVYNPDKNVTCLMVQMDIKVNFTYQALDNSSKTVVFQVPANQTTVKLSGSTCGEKEDTLEVTWKEGNAFDMTFATNGSKYDLVAFVITLNTSSLYNDSAINQTVTVSHIHENESYIVPSNFSYHCNREKTLNATNGYIIVSKVQFEAFKSDNAKKFSAAKDCDSHITPDIVPIAVGISLIALIVVVLVAYIVGRKRQPARGYLNIM